MLWVPASSSPQCFQNPHFSELLKLDISVRVKGAKPGDSEPLNQLFIEVESHRVADVILSFASFFLILRI